MDVTIAPTLPLSNDWTGLSYKELTEKVSQHWRAQNPEGYLSRTGLKQLTHDARMMIKSGDYANLQGIFGDQSERLTHSDPTARVAIRLADASQRTRERILFELGEGAA